MKWGWNVKDPERDKLAEYSRSLDSNKFSVLIYDIVFFSCHVLKNVVRVIEG